MVNTNRKRTHRNRNWRRHLLSGKYDPTKVKLEVSTPSVQRKLEISVPLAPKKVLVNPHPGIIAVGSIATILTADYGVRYQGRRVLIEALDGNKVTVKSTKRKSSFEVLVEHLEAV